jgi:hypothetical protein
MEPKVYDLIASFTTSMKEAAARLKDLERYFPERIESLQVDAQQIHEQRAGILNFLLVDVASEEEEEACRLLLSRRKRQRKHDEDEHDGGEREGEYDDPVDEKPEQRAIGNKHKPLLEPSQSEEGNLPKANLIPEPLRAIVIIKEAAGKRIRELRVEEIDVGLDQFQVSIALDDGSSLFIALTVTAVTPHVQVGLDFAQSVDGENVPLEYANWLPRQWPQTKEELSV